MRERQILINNVKTNIKISGEGEPLLILHGWGGSSDSWIKTQAILSKNGFKVIAPDLPGFGKSITPPIPWEVKDYSNFILGLTQELNLKNFFLLGHSFGSRIAVKFALAFPEKVKKLILCNASGIKGRTGVKTWLIYQIARVGNAIFTPRVLARFRDHSRNLFYIFIRHHDYVKADGTMKETLKKVCQEDLLPILSEIKTKTLIIWGDKDKMVPVKFAHIFKKNIEDSELIILPRIGHSPHLEVPGTLAEIILSFLKK